MSPHKSDFESQQQDDNAGPQGVLSHIRSQLDNDGKLAMDYYFGWTPVEIDAQASGKLEELYQLVRQKEVYLKQLHADHLGIPIDIYYERLANGRESLAKHLSQYNVF